MIIATDGSAFRDEGGMGIVIKNGDEYISYHAVLPKYEIISVEWNDGLVYKLSDIVAKPTNNRAELLAPIIAKLIADNLYPAKRTLILSDSEYAIKHLTGKWASPATDEEMRAKPNGDLGMLIRDHFRGKPGYHVQWIKAHQAKKDMIGYKSHMNMLADTASKYSLNDERPLWII